MRFPRLDLVEKRRETAGSRPIRITKEPSALAEPDRVGDRLLQRPEAPPELLQLLRTHRSRVISVKYALLGNARVIRVVALQRVEEFADADDMRCADVPSGGSSTLVDQEQRLGKVADVDDVPELVPHLVRASFQ